MRSPIYLRLSMLALIVLAFATTHAQTNADKIKAKWLVEKFDAEKNTAQAIKASQALAGVSLSFEQEELIITKKTETGDSVIKRGPYSIAGNMLTLGKDSATIVELSEKQLTIQIPNQGLLYLLKM